MYSVVYEQHHELHGLNSLLLCTSLIPYAQKRSCLYQKHYSVKNIPNVINYHLLMRKSYVYSGL
jgi:hypothetical protein